MSISQDGFTETRELHLGDGTIVYDIGGRGPLIVLAHGMGDSRVSFRFLMPALIEAGYRVANVDVRGCGDSSPSWPGYSRTDIAGDLVALIRELGGSAVIVGQSISGGAATIAAATAPADVVGVVELAPFTRSQSVDIAGLLRDRVHRAATVNLARMLLAGSVRGWLAYLELAIPTKPADWSDDRARFESALSRPERMAALRGMARTTPADAGACLADVHQPVLIIEGSADPDWADPRAEGERILADLPEGVGELVVLDGVGHYPHVEAPLLVREAMLPFLQRIPHVSSGLDRA